MQLVMQKHDVRERVREAMDQRNVRGIQTPLDLLREVEAMDPEEGRRFAKSMRAFRPRIVVNEVRERRGDQARLLGAQRLPQVLRHRRGLRRLREP